MLVSRPMAFSRQSFGPARTVAAILLTSVCLLAVEPCAFAQTDDDRAGARVAATEGVKASNEKRWADAADLFARAESLVHSPVHLLYLARAQEKLGKLVKARENYNRIIREKYGADAPDAFRQAQTSAQQEVGGLDARLAAITVKLDGEKGAVTVAEGGTNALTLTVKIAPGAVDPFAATPATAAPGAATGGPVAGAAGTPNGTPAAPPEPASRPVQTGVYVGLA